MSELTASQRGIKEGYGIRSVFRNGVAVVNKAAYNAMRAARGEEILGLKAEITYFQTAEFATRREADRAYFRVWAATNNSKEFLASCRLQPLGSRHHLVAVVGAMPDAPIAEQISGELEKGTPIVPGPGLVGAIHALYGGLFKYGISTSSFGPSSAPRTQRR